MGHSWCELAFFKIPFSVLLLAGLILYQMIAIAVGCVLALIAIALALQFFLNLPDRRRNAPNPDASIKKSNSIVANSPAPNDISRDVNSLVVPLSRLSPSIDSSDVTLTKHVSRIPASLQECSCASDGDVAKTTLLSKVPSQPAIFHNPWAYTQAPRTEFELELSTEGHRAFGNPFHRLGENDRTHLPPLPLHATLEHLRRPRSVQDPNNYTRPLAVEPELHQVESPNEIATDRKLALKPSLQKHTFSRVNPLALSSFSPRAAATSLPMPLIINFEEIPVLQASIPSGPLPLSAFTARSSMVASGNAESITASQSFTHARIHRTPHSHTKSIAGNENSTLSFRGKLRRFLNPDLAQKDSPTSPRTAWPEQRVEVAAEQASKPSESLNKPQNIPRLNLPFSLFIPESQYILSSRRSPSQVGISLAEDSTSGPDSDSELLSMSNLNQTHDFGAQSEFSHGNSLKAFYPREVHVVDPAVSGSLISTDITSELQLPRVSPPGFVESLLDPAELERISDPWLS